ncbi:MAG: glycogen synthase, partial [Candidatus Izemoplasmataceae bacterium]
NYEEVYKKVLSKIITYGTEEFKIRLYQLDYKQVSVYFIESFRFFERDNIYGYEDDCDRFAFFNYAVTQVIDAIGEIDVVHVHDWHTALIPLILEHHKKDINFKTILTLHNIDYQGVCNQSIIKKLSIDDFMFHEERINFLEIGINTADKLTTVSPTYRDELRYDYYGKNLTHSLLKRERDFYGILNGISSKNNPQYDALIISKYSLQNLTPKTDNKLFLQKEMKLEMGLDYFIIGVVSRITEQKGFDLIIPAMDELLKVHKNVQFILLGTGDENYINRLEDLNTKYPRQVALNIGYDSTIPNYIYAGADLFLMPSRVEPCGLSQMISMRYGTIPLVRTTGGLADTVTNFDPITKQGNGFSFYPYDVASLKQTLYEAYRVYHEEKTVWKKMIKRAMRADYSLERQATKMIELYRLMLEN